MTGSGTRPRCWHMATEDEVYAASKLYRYGATREVLDHFAEELADVRLMSQKLCSHFKLESQVSGWHDYKFNRLIARIKGEK